MRILYFTHYYPPEGNAPATRVSALAKRWVQSGHDVTVITCVPNVPHGKVYAGYRNRLWPQREEKDGVKIIRVWTWVAPNKGLVGRILNYVSYMVAAWLVAVTLRKPDIFIATSPQFFCGWAGVLYRYWVRATCWFRRSPPFVLEIRDIWPESIGAVDAIQNKWILGFLQFLEGWMYRAANHIVTVGEGYKQRLIERKVPADKMTVVMNGWDNDMAIPEAAASQALRATRGWEGQFVCAYIGTIGMACGLDIFIRAAKLLEAKGEKGISLVAVGDGAIREELDRQCTEAGIRSVHFVGLQPKESMPTWLMAADACFVHLKKTPLFETVIPSKIFEASGLKRPIIIGVNGEARRLVLESGGGIAIEPEDENQLVAAIERLRDDPEYAAGLGAAGCEYVGKNFSRDHLANRYLECLTTVCEKS